MTPKCSKCGTVLSFYREISERGKVIKVCRNSSCTMYNYEISFSER